MMNVNRNPVVTMMMCSHEKIVAELFPQEAPNTVCNFISLASKGFYDGLSFHRIIRDIAIQGGDPDGNGMGNPGYCIRGEFLKNGHTNSLRHQAGALSMARAVFYDTAGSQFFIMCRDAPHMDGRYAVFGRVMDGLDIVERIAGVEVDYAGRPLHPQVILKVKVETFGIIYPEPEKL